MENKLEKLKRLIDLLVKNASVNMRTPTGQPILGHAINIDRMMMGILSEKKSRSANKNEYIQSLIDNNCFFEIKEGLWLQWLENCIMSKELPPYNTALNQYSVIKELARREVQNKESSRIKNALTRYQKLMRESSDVIRELEIMYIVYRIQNDLVLEICEELYQKEEYEFIFSSNIILNDGGKLRLIYDRITEMTTEIIKPLNDL